MFTGYCRAYDKVRNEYGVVHIWVHNDLLYAEYKGPGSFGSGPLEFVENQLDIKRGQEVDGFEIPNMKDGNDAELYQRTL